MSLLTRCPHCKTLFRVTPAQLQARGGNVRCGRCMAVFDGFEALAVEQAAAAADGSAAVPPASSAHPPVAERPPSAEVVASPPAGAAAAAGTPPAEPAPAVPSDRGRAAPAPKPAPRASRGIVAACVFLALLLVLQLGYGMRSHLAARYAPLHAMFDRFCGAVGCSVPLPQRPQLLRIEASDVRMVDASRPALMQLTATIRSYSDHLVGYPAIDLVLTNATDHALARRVFLPREYLGASRDAKAGISSRAEVTVVLDLDVGDLGPSGFRIDLLPAP